MTARISMASKGIILAFTVYKVNKKRALKLAHTERKYYKRIFIRVRYLRYLNDSKHNELSTFLQQWILWKSL